MEESIRAVAAQNSSFKQKIGDWAKEIGKEATAAQLKGEGTSLSYSFMKFLVFNKIREALGMDRTKICITGAAPISRSTLDYFISLNIPLFNTYGMSECAGPCTINLPYKNSIYSAGSAIPGVDLQIFDK
jgi:long-subunit acyl-CoA synthetase (AMP-forming)|mmetsp:Transcript_21742/g.3600  ORF Transcript_21742/g.3600 Transcript_21742/m.3600 type:complete len:130 (+) Transcript_21742:975-1364(+)